MPDRKPPIRPRCRLVQPPKSDNVWVPQGGHGLEALSGYCMRYGDRHVDTPSEVDWTPLARERVVLVPLLCDAGQAWAAEATRELYAAGASAVRVLELVRHFPALPWGAGLAAVVEPVLGDAAGGRALAKRLRAAAAATPIQPVPGARP